MIDLKQIKKIKIVNYDKKVKETLLSMGYKLEYNVMYKTVHHQGIKLVLDFSAHDLGLARVEMPNTFYIEFSEWIELNKNIVSEIKLLREKGVVV